MSRVPVNTPEISHKEVLICETQARMLFPVEPQDEAEVLEVIRKEGVPAEVIGEITAEAKEVFKYEGEIIAEIPNEPTPEMMQELRS